MAPSTAPFAAEPRSPPTSDVVVTTAPAVVPIVSIASPPTSLVPRNTPMTAPFAAAPISPPTSAAPWIVPRTVSEIAEVSAPPTAPVFLTTLTRLPLTVSTTASVISPTPRIAPIMPSFTESTVLLSSSAMRVPPCSLSNSNHDRYMVAWIRRRSKPSRRTGESGGDSSAVAAFRALRSSASA